MPTFALRDKMNATSAPLPRGDNEFFHAGLTMAPCNLVKPPRVAESPAVFECRVTDIIGMKDVEGRPTGAHLVLGQVIGVHIDERFVANGMVDTAAMQPIARCGYHDYAVVDRVFSLKRPG
jgi:flavin reductase (DIM6/NTAB) family NADH-FMN oxidoreductase RutF